MSQRHPWESIRKHLYLLLCRELYFECAYLAAGNDANREARGVSSKSCALRRWGLVK
jgi:hypothetical protein